MCAHSGHFSLELEGSRIVEHTGNVALQEQGEHKPPLSTQHEPTAQGKSQPGAETMPFTPGNKKKRKFKEALSLPGVRNVPVCKC